MFRRGLFYSYLSIRNNVIRNLSHGHKYYFSDVCMGSVLR